MKRALIVICAVGLADCGQMAEILIGAGRQRPRELEDAGVRMGEGRFEKSVWLDEPSLGEITSLTDSGPRGILAAGTTAAAYVKDGALSDRVVWSEPMTHVEPIDVEADGRLEFLDRGGHGWQGAALLDGGGRPRFRPAGGQGVDDMAAGHLDADGRLDFVVGYNGGSGVARHDASGRELWRQEDGNVWHVEIVDTDADGMGEIVHSNARGQLTVRDASGRVLRRVDPPGSYFSSFSLVKWPRSAPPRPLHAADGTLWITNYTGGTAVQLAAPSADTLGDARAVAVRFGKDDHLGALVAFSNWERSVFYVFDAAGTLAYREVMPDECRALAGQPAETGDDLLVACGTRIWRYRAPAGGGSPGSPSPSGR
jgi:hypothetical protein